MSFAGRKAAAPIDPTKLLSSDGGAGGYDLSQIVTRFNAFDLADLYLPRTNTGLAPTDSLFAEQWHLFDAYGVDTDINVTTVWPRYSGNGIHVGVYDDGIQSTHPDLNANYDASREFNGGINATNVVNAYSDGSDKSHGTVVAGTIAAALDGFGSVGVAYNAKVTAVPIYGDSSIDATYYFNAMLHQRSFDVTNHSWGWYTPFANQMLSQEYANIEGGFAISAREGRGGLGTIMVSCAMNGRVPFTENGDSFAAEDANAAGPMQASRYGITVGAIGDDGFVASYSNPGASLLVVAPSGDDGRDGLVTTDLHGGDGWATGGHSRATDGFWGTSFAAPQVAGVAALMLEANPNLGWRDVKEILANSATHVGSAIGSAPSGDEFHRWKINGADDWNAGGRHFSEDYGFGLVDAHAAVRLAETWTEQKTTANESYRLASADIGSDIIPDNNSTGLTYQFHVDDQIDIETIQLNLGVTHTWAQDLQVELTSPSGTTTALLHNSGGDADINGQWNFSANAFLGESGAGYWTLRVRDTAAGDVGRMDFASLYLFGSQPSSDNTYVFTDEFGYLAGVASDTTRNAIADFDDGTDTLNIAAVTAGSAVDLATGAATIAGRALTIHGTLENVYSGDGSDTLTGNAADNVFWAGLGANTVSGGEGNDTFIVTRTATDIVAGDGGSDALSYAKFVADVTVDLATGYDRFYISSLPWHTLGSVTFSSIENVIGGAGNDTIQGDGANNRLDGGTGVDTLNGMDGDDTLLVTDEYNPFAWDLLDGGVGTDTLSFEKFTTAVTADLATGIYKSTKFFNMENLTGGSAGDTLSGDDNANVITSGGGSDTVNGRGGDDTLILTRTGTKTVDGGDGIDTLSYVSSTIGLTLDLAEGGQSFYGYRPFVGFGRVGSVTFTGVENLEGGSGGDTLSGDGGDNTLIGNAGNDVLAGRGGSDVLAGGSAGDTFKFDWDAVAGALASAPVDVVRDYDQGDTGAYSASEGDRLDLSAVLAPAYNLGDGQAVGSLVRVVEDAGGAYANVQVDIDGAANGASWLTIARLDGVHAGDAVNVILDAALADGSTVLVKADDAGAANGGATANDFDGDGNADILFANGSSAYLWLMQDRSATAQAAIDLFDPTLSVQVAGDFDGDGNTDLLFQNPATGGVWQWQLDGAIIKAQGAVDVADASFHLLGTADFNGDGRSDVLWRNDAGFLYQWQMNGAANTPVAVGSLDPAWHVQGAGDFDGDGRADLLLRNAGATADNGAYYLWQMDGAVIVGQGGIERPDAAWHTLGTGDFDGDGKTDVALRNVSAGADNGAVWVWLMDGTSIKAQGAAGIADPATWHVQQVADLNGDGNDDILFRNDAGHFYSWDMDGASIASEGLLEGVAQWADPAFAVVAQHWELI